MQRQQILPFRIIEASSEDANFPSSELTLESGKGWQSARHTPSPHHLIIQPLLDRNGNVAGSGEHAIEADFEKSKGDIFVPTLSQIQIRLSKSANTQNMSQKIELFAAVVADDTIAVTADGNTGITNGDYDDVAIATDAKYGARDTKGVIDKAKVQSIPFESLGCISYASRGRVYHETSSLSQHQSQEQGRDQGEGESQVKIISLDHVPASLLKVMIHDFDSDAHHSGGLDMNDAFNKRISKTNTRMDCEHNSDSDSQVQTHAHSHAIGIMAITLYGSMVRLDKMKDDFSIAGPGTGTGSGNDSGEEMPTYSPLEKHLEMNNAARANRSTRGTSKEVHANAILYSNSHDMHHGHEKDRSLEQILLIKQKTLKEYFDQLDWRAFFHHNVINPQETQQNQSTTLKENQGIDRMQTKKVLSNLVSLLQTVKEYNIVLNSAVARENYSAASTLKSQRNATQMILSNSLAKLNRVLALEDDADEENTKIDKVRTNDESECSKRRQVNIIQSLSGIGTCNANIESTMVSANESRDKQLKQSLDDLSLSTIRRVDNDNEEVVDPSAAMGTAYCIESPKKEPTHSCHDYHNTTACTPPFNSLDDRPIRPTKQKTFEDLPILSHSTATTSEKMKESEMDSVDHGRQSFVMDEDGSHPLEGVPNYMDLPIPENRDNDLDGQLSNSSRSMKSHHNFSNTYGSTPTDIQHMDKILGPYRSQCIRSKNWALREAAVLKLSLDFEDVIDKARSDLDAASSAITSTRDDWVEVIARGMCAILHLAIYDLSVQVYLTGLILFDECLLQFERMKIISQRKVKTLFSHHIFYLVGKLADGNSKVAEAAHTALVSLAFCELVGPLHISAQVIKRISPSKETKDKSAVRRVQVLRALFEEFGHVELREQIETTMNFLATCGFSHPHIEVREESRSLATLINNEMANTEGGVAGEHDQGNTHEKVQLGTGLESVTSKTPGRKRGRGRGRLRKGIYK